MPYLPKGTPCCQGGVIPGLPICYLRPIRNPGAPIFMMLTPRPEVIAATSKREAAEWIKIVHERYRASGKRSQGPDEQLRWARAETAFHGFKSGFGYGWDSFVVNNIRADLAMREFAIGFLELDPWFRNSGYIKARFLQRLKACSLSPVQCSQLNAVLLDAARNRPGREYRRYCRLAAIIAEPWLIKELHEMSLAKGSAASRARIMLEAVGV